MQNEKRALYMRRLRAARNQAGFKGMCACVLDYHTFNDPLVQEYIESVSIEFDLCGPRSVFGSCLTFWR